MYAEKIQVVAVCNNEARVYGLPDEQDFRRFIRMEVFTNHGQAVQFANEFEEGQRRKPPPETEEVKQRRRRSFKQPEKENT